MTAVYAIIVFLILIFVHEAGHFMAAKLCRVRVNKFAIGMGPAILKKQKGETEYSLRAIPVGGFCAMEGEDSETDDPRGFNNQNAIKKMIIVIAGSVMNILLAIILMMVVAYHIGTPINTVDKVSKGSPAMGAGVISGDRIVSVDGKRTGSWSELQAAVNQAKNGQVKLQVDRKGELLSVTSPYKEAEGRKIIGIMPVMEKSLGGAVKSGPAATWNMTKGMYKVIKGLITGEVSGKNLTGPVGIVHMVGQAGKSGLINLIYLMALISLNLGIVNMLPIPALDGGRLLMIVIRLFTGNAISDRREGQIQMVGFLLLILLMVYVTFNDVIRLILPSFK